MKKGNNNNRQKHFTNIQAQGSSDIASSINKQIKTSTRSKTSIFLQLPRDYVLLQRIIKCQQFNEFICGIYVANEEVRLRQGLSIIYYRVSAFLTLKTMQSIRQKYLQLLFYFNNSYINFQRRRGKSLTFKAHLLLLQQLTGRYKYL